MKPNLRADIAPLVIGIILSVFVTSASAESGNDLLQKVKAKYSSCATFSGEGSNTTKSDMQGKDKPYRNEKRFSILFKRPDLLRVDWSEPNMMSFTPVVCSLYTDSGKYYGVSSFKRTPEEFKNLEMGMGTYAGISGGNTYLIPSMLLGERGFISETCSETLPDAQIDGVDCSVIQINDKKTGKWTYTVNKATLAILRIQQVHTITAEQSKAMMDDANQRMKDKNIPFPETPARDYTIETITTFKKVAFDQDMTAADFVFTDAKPLNGL